MFFLFLIILLVLKLHMTIKKRRQHFINNHIIDIVHDNIVYLLLLIIYCQK